MSRAGSSSLVGARGGPGASPGARGSWCGLLRALLRPPGNGGGGRVSSLALGGKAWGEAEERDAGEERRGLNSGEGRVFKHLRGPLERKGAGDLGP